MARNLLQNSIRMINSAVESRLTSLVHNILPVPLLALSEGSTLPPPSHTPQLDANKDFSILFSKRRMGDRMTSEYVDGENSGYFNRADKDIIGEKMLDFQAECPRWMRDRRGREWRPALPRFIEGVITELVIRKPIKPNSGNRKCARVQVTLWGRQKVITARIQGEKNTLQQHHRVLVQWGRARNLPGVKWVIVRGQLDAQY